MLDENSTLTEETPEPQPEEKGNKTFLIVGGIFAGLIFLTLICMAGWFLWLGPRLEAAQEAQVATADALAQAQALEMTSTAEAALFTPTPRPSLTFTRTHTVAAATNTPVVILSTPENTPEPTATLDQTQLADQMTQTAAVLSASTPQETPTVETGFPQETAGTPGVGTSVAGATPLPTTGFFDEVGLPLLIVLTFALLAVIFITRRLRKAPTR